MSKLKQDSQQIQEKICPFASNPVHQAFQQQPGCLCVRRSPVCLFVYNSKILAECAELMVFNIFFFSHFSLCNGKCVDFPVRYSP